MLKGVAQRPSSKLEEGGTVLSWVRQLLRFWITSHHFLISILSGEIRDSINHVKRDMANQYAGGKGAQAQAKVSCPEVSCTSTTVLLGALAAQLVILMAYLMYRDNKENKAKKFY